MRTKVPGVLIVAALSIWSVQTSARDVSLVDAARMSDAAGVERALKERADVNGAEGDGMTGLHWAAATGNVDVADLLLRAGADIQRKTRVGAYTPLLIASRYGHEAVVQRLLAAASDPNVANVNGTTALMFAASAGGGAVKTLLAHGADVNVREKARDQTALMFAAAYNRADAVRLFDGSRRRCERKGEDR